MFYEYIHFPTLDVVNLANHPSVERDFSLSHQGNGEKEARGRKTEENKRNEIKENFFLTFFFHRLKQVFFN